MTINSKIFYYPSALNDLVTRFDSDSTLLPMDDTPSESPVKDLIDEDVEELDDNGLATIKGWPAECYEEKQYWERVNAYPGGTLERTSIYVHNLLNDENLSTPSTAISLNTKYETNLPLLDQTMHDLRRRDRVTINDKVIYTMTSLNDSVEIFMKGWTDAQKAKYTFKACMKALHKNYHLTTNALKLTTQATLARLTRLIMPRFSNTQLPNPKLILCGVQRVNIDTREDAVTRILYHSFWGIVTMEAPRKPIKHMKGSVEFVIATDDLKSGKTGYAREFERCSPFFDSFEEVEQCGEWPADSETPEIYDKRMEIFPNYKEHLHPLITAPILKSLIENEKLSTSGCLDCATQSHFLPLKKLTLFETELYNESSLLSKIPNQGEFISNKIDKSIKAPKVITQKLIKLSCLGIGELLTKITYSRFSKPTIDRHVSCYEYELIISKTDESEEYEIKAISKWHTRDISKDEIPNISKFGVLLIATIKEDEILLTKPNSIDIQLEIRTLYPGL